MIKNYFKIAWRNLLRTKVYSIINISGLSIGLACCMLIILYSKDEISFDRFHKNVDKIFRITSTWIKPDGTVESTSGITGMMPGPIFKKEIPGIKEFVRVQNEQVPVKIGNEIFDQPALYVDDNFFSVFNFPLLSGNAATALKNLHAVVISEEVAKKFFGTGDAVGKILALPFGENAAFENFTVAGVVPGSPQNSSIRINMLLPMKLNEQRNGGDVQWMNFFLNTFIVLEPGVKQATIEAQFQRVYHQYAQAEIKEMKEKYDVKSRTVFGLQPLTGMHMSADYGSGNGLTEGGSSTRTNILTGIALFILLIACINFINLTVARSLKRAKEIGIRKVVGGARKQLIAQFLLESFLLSFFSFILAILLVLAILPIFNSLIDKSLSFSYLLDIKLVLGYIALFILTSLLAGFYPAIVLSGFKPVQTLYNRMPLSGKNYFSKGLIILQFTLATFLIIATVTIYNQYKYISHFNLGYSDKNLVIINIDRAKAGKIARIKDELKTNPAIVSVAARQRGNWETIAKVDGNQIEFSRDIIDTGFLTTLQIPLVAGRNFSAEFVSDSTRSVLVNEAFVKKAGWNNIENRHVDFFYDSIKYDVIGVVKDYHYASLKQEIRPQLFSMDPKFDYGQLIVRINPERTSATLKHIEKVVKSEFPFIPYKYDFKDVSNADQYKAEEKSKQVISFASILTIFISCIGLFGLATLAAEKRTKEIGIRKVLGASVAAISRMLSAGFLKLVMIATLLAFPAAWFTMNKWLQNYPYRVSINIWVFGFAALIVVLVALCTISFQAIKSALANPVKNLRSE